MAHHADVEHVGELPCLLDVHTALDGVAQHALRAVRAHGQDEGKNREHARGAGVAGGCASRASKSRRAVRVGASIRSVSMVAG